MAAEVPWLLLVGRVEPFYPQGKGGRPPMEIESMLRIYFLQQWYGLADEALPLKPMRIPARALYAFQIPRSAPSFPPCKTRSGGRAFTLIEVLVVISIIAVLAGLLLSALRSIHSSSDNTKCVSNLRQIAMAVNAYANDNDDYFPGPLYHGQAPYDAGGSLTFFLVPYLGLSTTNLTWTPENSVFVCPSFARAARATPGFNAAVIPGGWWPNYLAIDYGGTGIRPLGYPDPGGQPVLRRAAIAGMINPVSALKMSIDATKSVAYREVRASDYGLYGSVGGLPNWFLRLPDNALHGGHINAIFWDWHIGRLDSTTLQPLS